MSSPLASEGMRAELTAYWPTEQPTIKRRPSSRWTVIRELTRCVPGSYSAAYSTFGVLQPAASLGLVGGWTIPCSASMRATRSAVPASQ